MYWILIGFDAIIVLVAGKLLALHYFLMKKGITTFTYIKFEMQKQEKKEDIKNGSLTKEEYQVWFEKTYANLDKYKVKSKSKIEIKKLKTLETKIKSHIN